MASKQRPQPLAEELAAMFDGGASSCSSSPAPLTACSQRLPTVTKGLTSAGRSKAPTERSTSCWISDVPSKRVWMVASRCCERRRRTQR